MTDHDATSISPAVTHVTPMSGDPAMRVVRAAGRVVARLSDVEAAELGVEIGVPWTRDLAAAAASARTRRRAWRAALRHLRRRPFGRAELTERLGATFSRELAESIVAALAEQGLLDDKVFATWVADSMRRRRGAAPALVQAELEARSIDEHTGDAAIDDAWSEESPEETALRWARGWMRRRRAPASAAERAAIAGRLATSLGRRGHDEEVVRTVLDRLELPIPGESDPEMIDG